jgi:hypothetical protein
VSLPALPVLTWATRIGMESHQNWNVFYLREN